MISTARTDRGRELDPGELASASVMASLCLGLAVLASIVPYLGPLQFATVVPFGVVAERHRLRAVIAALAASAFVAALVLGLGTALATAVCAALGGLVGVFRRRGWGIRAVWLTAAVLAPVAAILADVALLIFASYRALVLQNARSTLRGVARTLHHLGPLKQVGDHVEHAGLTVVNHWALAAAGLVLIVVTAALLLSWWLLNAVLDRLRWIADGESATVVGDPAAAPSPPAPVPVALEDVSVSYGTIEALADIDLRITSGEFIAVVGDNGSGKSTLARLLAGAQPTAGTIHRDGPVGLGKPGGTAVISQRPDAQVVGLRVAEDILWGLPEDHPVDVDELLTTVGLDGMADRDTSSLSGGQLQRLGVAAALARRPQLLISDESTAMIDPPGRRELTRLFARLARERRMTVVHITHHAEELSAADRVLRLERGRLLLDAPPQDARPGELAPPAEATRRPLHAVRRASPAGGLVLRELGHSYAHGTVWEHRALDRLTLSIEQGEGVLVVGQNGSGKSTLAWILAGLIRPTEGECLIGGVPTHRRRGAIGLAFQHARLQLQRPTVAADIADAAGWAAYAGHQALQEPLDDPALELRIVEALRSARLDPELASRSIEQLSGGQQRRVAIAGLLARGPRVLVLDEPLAGLDAPARAGLVALLAELRERDGLTLIVVTHDPETLASVCPRTLRLEQGRLVGDGADSDPEQLREISAA